MAQVVCTPLVSSSCDQSVQLTVLERLDFSTNATLDADTAQIIHYYVGVHIRIV